MVLNANPDQLSLLAFRPISLVRMTRKMTGPAAEAFPRCLLHICPNKSTNDLDIEIYYINYYINIMKI